MTRKLSFWFLILLSGCAGLDRSCSSSCATSLGADWVIVQIDALGRPFRCWALENTSVDNEQSTDGIYWQSPNGHLVHISGFYNRVQVQGGRWSQALAEVGLTPEACRALNRRSRQENEEEEADERADELEGDAGQ